MTRCHQWISGWQLILCATIFSRWAYAHPIPGTPPKTLQISSARSPASRYLLYLPRGYGDHRATTWPLLVLLHGSRACGRDLELVNQYALTKLVAPGKELPFIIVAPQCPKGHHWSPEVIVSTINEVTKHRSVDPRRVYITGFSLGGRGTWETALKYPHRFAAIAPICGRCDATDVKPIKDNAVWIFHGEDDRVVPVNESRRMAASLNRMGNKVRLTVYPNTGHDAWTRTYENPELYSWFLKHRQ